MRICGREFGEGDVCEVRRILAENPDKTRRGLSRLVCEEFGWRSLNGKYKEVNCRKALLELERRGAIRLPEARKGCFEKRAERKGSEVTAPEVECELRELGEIRVTPVNGRNNKRSRIWNHLMERYHYLGKGPLCGGQIRYLVESAEYGYVGAMSYSGSQWRMRARDEYIGWTEKARREHLNDVVCNSRFLILPTVRVRNLASRVLGLSLERLAGDWRERYGYEPVLAETFVDTERYAGTCYQAANWIQVGETAGRGKIYRNGKKSEGRKAIYVYPLSRNWRERLCGEEEKALGSIKGTKESRDWAEEEFGRVEFYDDRLRARLRRLAETFHAQPGVLIPEACAGGKAEVKAAYRFFRNRNVNMQTLLRPHIESTIDRVREHEVVLAVQDTTSLNYTAHPPDGVGLIGTNETSAVGFELHDTMAFTPEGIPLGLLNIQCWAREEKEAGDKKKRRNLPIEEKESRKWIESYRAAAEVQKACPGTMIVSVGDRESDIYDLFYEAAQTPEGTEFLVRSERSRRRKVVTGNETEELWAKMATAPVAGTMEVAIPRRGTRPKRTAKLHVSYSEEKLKSPKGGGFPEIDVWAVYARETGYGAEVREPLEWMLLTSVRTESFEQACERLNWYGRRWGIEVYHRILKSGCRIEDRRLADADSLQSCLAIDLVVGWRVFWFTMVGREKPDESSDKILSEDEWRVLGIWATKTILKTAPSVKQAMHWIGKMGGWLQRGKLDNPGATCMWRGLSRLPAMAQGYRMAIDMHGLNPSP